ncbi:MAG: ChbG/HpnK family deacetylase [Candidatus Acidiferrales bacterium]
MKRLIVNADDFGITRGVNRGILQSHREGIVTSATIMAGGDAFEDAVETARANPSLGVGVHIVLTGGRSVAPPEKIGSLTGREGRLPRSISRLLYKWHAGLIRRQDIENEMRAQIAKVVDAGIKPTHLDTHKHAHCHPSIMKALATVAKEFGITRVRMPFEDSRAFSSRAARSSKDARRPISRRLFILASRAARPAFRGIIRKNHLHAPAHFFGFAATGRLDSDAILHILRNLPEGTSELVCHPGICDADLRLQPTRLLEHRQAELAALTDTLTRKAIVAEDVRLINYSDLN